MHNRSSIFLSPTISTFHIDDEIMDLWMEDQLNLTAWNTNFRLASNSLRHENSDYVTKESLKR